MKRFAMFCLCWLMFLCVTTSGSSPKLQYTLYFASTMENEYTIKEQLLEEYETLTRSTDADSHSVLIRRNTEQFLTEYDRVISFENGMLTVTFGDGLGSVISGYFGHINCMPEVKPKSLVKEWIDSWDN